MFEDNFEKELNGSARKNYEYLKQYRTELYKINKETIELCMARLDLLTEILNWLDEMELAHPSASDLLKELQDKLMVIEDKIETKASNCFAKMIELGGLDA
ncbi:hypothetical protein [Ileibacterium valens]|uniref:hypothetical protein n=1 Tax=Ileibacterium valens TaxID=1862668 RepID=UPI00272CB9EB|nr:hypothetical protein [Ileibacterium valens]